MYTNLNLKLNLNLNNKSQVSIYLNIHIFIYVFVYVKVNQFIFYLYVCISDIIFELESCPGKLAKKESLVHGNGPIVSHGDGAKSTVGPKT